MQSFDINKLRISSCSGNWRVRVSAMVSVRLRVTGRVRVSVRVRVRYALFVFGIYGL